MKKVLFCTLCFAALSVNAVNYCASQSWGYAGNGVTGGGNATPTLVSNATELATALGKKGSVIIITQDITVSNHISSDKSNLTIMALPGAKLISNQQNKDNSGILYLKGSNLLLRNLTFEGPGAYDCDGWDNLCLDGAKNVWVDHCDFQDGCDGNFDIKSTSDNITVSWCRFRYLKEPKAGGPGGADDHRFTNLVGSSSSDKPSDGTYNITYAFCWWDEGCKQRMTRCRNALIHYLNCYWNSSVADYYVGPENVSSYFEGCTFAGSANRAERIWKPFNNNTNYCKFVNCTGNTPSDAGNVAAPSYTYDQLTAATAKNHVTNASCGAGATLSVTDAAEVSSDCDDGQGPVDPVIVDGNCCIDLSLGEEPTVANGGIPADYGNLSVIANLVKGKWDQGYLNMGGNADYITFDFTGYEDAVIEAVEFDVTIPNWEAAKNTVAYHWNSDANSLYYISGSEKETVSLSAPAGARSFTIQRSAGTGTRISQVCFQVKNNSTRLETVKQPEAAHKVLHDRQILILRGGSTYTLSGQQL